MRNILVIIGSGIMNGNTDRLAEVFIKGATEAGHTVNRVFLGDKTLSGCLGCGKCQDGSHICTIKDDMQEIYPLFAKCDTVVLASPLYFWTISAKTKAFIERLYAISENDTFPHKDSLLLMTAGDDEFWTFEQPISYYRFVTKAIRWTDIGISLAPSCNGEPGKRYIDDKYLRKAYKMGANI